jgi:hypothetical protein
MNEARIQDGTIHSADDFWQAIMDIGYIIEGENVQRRNRCRSA